MYSSANQTSIVKQLFAQVQCPLCLSEYDNSLHYPMIVCPLFHLACKKCTQTLLFHAHDSKTEQCPQPACQEQIKQQNVKRFKFVYFVKKGQYMREVAESQSDELRDMMKEKVEVLEIFINEEEEKIKELTQQLAQKDRRIEELSRFNTRMQQQLSNSKKQTGQLREEIKKLKARNPIQLKSQILQKNREWRPTTGVTSPQQILQQSLHTLIMSILNIESWSALQNLQQIDLGSNTLESLPKNFHGFNTLKVLVLSHCSLTALPGQFGNMANLTYLELNNNKLVSLPDSLCELGELNFLHLYCNRLEILPTNFGNLTNLLQLFISENRLTQLPASFSKLTNLVVLSIQANPLATFPEGFPFVHRLEYLQFSMYPQSPILQSLPIPSMKKLKKLVIWYLAHIDEEQNEKLLEDCLEANVMLALEEEWERIR